MMTDYADETELDVIIDGIQGINDAADAVNERAAAIERAASRIQASADGIEPVADRAAEAAAAKVSEAAAEALDGFRRDSAEAARAVADEAVAGAQARLGGLLRGIEAARKSLLRLAAVLATLMGATIAATYAVTSVAVEQVDAANASIEQTNELVEQVNDALNLALPPVQPIGGGLSAVVMNVYNGLIAIASIAFGIWVIYAIYRFLIKGRRF